MKWIKYGFWVLITTLGIAFGFIAYEKAEEFLNRKTGGKNDPLPPAPPDPRPELDKEVKRKLKQAGEGVKNMTPEEKADSFNESIKNWNKTKTFFE